MNYLYPDSIYPTGWPSMFRQEARPVNSGQFLPMAGFPDIFLEEKQSFEDARKLQSFYPRIAQEIQRHVEAECDKMEYEGSMMFDEYPDRLMVRRLADGITEKMKDFPIEEVQLNSLPQETKEELSMQSGGRRGSRRGNDWLGDFTQVLLLDEMHRRRCRHRRCRNRRYW